MARGIDRAAQRVLVKGVQPAIVAAVRLRLVEFRRGNQEGGKLLDRAAGNEEIGAGRQAARVGRAVQILLVEQIGLVLEEFVSLGFVLDVLHDLQLRHAGIQQPAPGRQS